MLSGRCLLWLRCKGSWAEVVRSVAVLAEIFLIQSSLTLANRGRTFKEASR